MIKVDQIEDSSTKTGTCRLQKLMEKPLKTDLNQNCSIED
jgi:hypothetical protein